MRGGGRVGGGSAAASVLLHAVVVAIVVASPPTAGRGPRGRGQAVEIVVQRVPRPGALTPTPLPLRGRGARSVTPTPLTVRGRADRSVTPTPGRGARSGTEQRVASVERRPRLPSPEPAEDRPEPRLSPAPIAPFNALPFANVAALAAAIEPTAPRGTAGVTVRGDGGGDADGTADEGAVDAVRELREELRERAQAGRPEARGVAAYFQESRKRFAAAWAPRTVRLPSRTKAMIQSMQAVNRAALDMMEGRSERARAAQMDGRVTPDEWRDALRDAAQRARAVNSAIVAVVYDATGRLVDVRITRSSGHDDLDRSVLAAAREGVGQEPAPPMPPDETASRPAGRVARYRFDVLMTAMPPVPPVVGVTFDESTGMFRVFYPGQINWKLRVVFLGARYGMDLRPESREHE